MDLYKCIGKLVYNKPIVYTYGLIIIAQGNELTIGTPLDSFNPQTKIISAIKGT